MRKYQEKLQPSRASVVIFYLLYPYRYTILFVIDLASFLSYIHNLNTLSHDILNQSLSE